MGTTYSGSVVRTTHVSGMFTVLGIFIGHRLRGLPVNTRRLSLCLIIISGFLCGGIVGVYIFEKLAFATLFYPGHRHRCSGRRLQPLSVASPPRRPRLSDGATRELRLDDREGARHCASIARMPSRRGLRELLSPARLAQ